MKYINIGQKWLIYLYLTFENLGENRWKLYQHFLIFLPKDFLHSPLYQYFPIFVNTSNWTVKTYNFDSFRKWKSFAQKLKHSKSEGDFFKQRSKFDMIFFLFYTRNLREMAANDKCEDNVLNKLLELKQESAFSLIWFGFRNLWRL